MKDEFVFNFEKLRVWQDARLMVKSVYEATSTFPPHEAYGLTNQIRRASVSVVSNLAEGNSKTSAKNKARFSEIAYASLMELTCQLILSVDLRYLSKEQYDLLKEHIKSISNQIISLKKYQLGMKG